MNITSAISIPAGPVRSFERTFSRRITTLPPQQTSLVLKRVNASLSAQNASVPHLVKLQNPVFLETLLAQKPAVFEGVRDALGLAIPELDPLRAVLQASRRNLPEIATVVHNLTHDAAFRQNLSAYLVYAGPGEEDANGVTRIWTDYRNEAYEIRFMRWRPQTLEQRGGTTPPHGHGQNRHVQGVMSLLSGELEEIVYRDAGEDGLVRRDRTNRVSAGGLGLIRPGLVHAVWNLASSPATSFHVYFGGRVDLGRLYHSVD